MAFCTHCNNNWSRLETQEYDGEETSEVCPVCKTDQFLMDNQPGPVYIHCPLTGRIIDVFTRLPKPSPVVAYTATKKHKEITPADVEAAEERRSAKEDGPLDAYQRAYDLHGEAAAKEAYSNALKEQSCRK